MKKIISLILFSSLCFANPLNFKTLSANFVQTITNNESKIEYKGNFIATNYLAFWHYSSPNLKNIYFNNKQVVIIEPNLEQVVVTNLKEVPNLTDILSKAIKKNKNIYETKYQNIVYTITFKKDILDEISYEDNLGNNVVIKLSNLKKDKDIDETNLVPIIPKDFDVIYNN